MARNYQKVKTILSTLFTCDNFFGIYFIVAAPNFTYYMKIHIVMHESFESPALMIEEALGTEFGQSPNRENEKITKE